MIESEDQDKIYPSTALGKLVTSTIVDVWQDNFETQLLKIVPLIGQFNVVGMDTEFPGTCYVPNVDFYYQSSVQSEHEYQLIRQNVKRSKIIQLGLSLSNARGEVPSEHCCWQFNFQFDLATDKISPDSQSLLERAGIDFKQLKRKGIRPEQFAQLLMVSGIILNEDVKWVVFHGGYDFAYLLHMLMGKVLPNSVEQFYSQLRLFFPTIYDLKFMIKETNFKEVGLNRLAYEINCERIGSQHQAGSDSLLTLSCYFRLRQQFNTKINFDKLSNVIFGIGTGYVSNYEYAKYSGVNQTHWTSDEMMFTQSQYDQAMYDYFQQMQMHGMSGYDLYNGAYYIQGIIYVPPEDPKDKKK